MDSKAKVTKINHVAIAVENIDQALAFWHGALGLELAHVEAVPSEGAQVAFLPTGDSEVELVQPTVDDSGLARYLQKRGPGMHHICLEVDDIEAMLAQLKAQGIRLINEQPRQGSGGKRYAFIHPESSNGVLVELYEMRGNR